MSIEMLFLFVIVMCLGVVVEGELRPESSSGFSSDHLRLLQYNNKTGNFLFRSGKIVKGITVQFDKLTSAMEKVAQQQGVKWPRKYEVIDLCLLNDEIDAFYEHAYFALHKSEGTFKHWSTHGVDAKQLEAACMAAGGSNCSNPTAQPQSYPASVVEAIAKAYPSKIGLTKTTDDLIYRVDKIHQYMTTKKHVPQVILFHCSCGCDRTGEMSAAYAMRYMNQTWTQAMTYDVSVPERCIGYHNQVASQWYCQYLFYAGLYSSEINDCGKCQPFRCGGKCNYKPPVLALDK